MSNQSVWDTHYTRTRSEQLYPDENVVRVLKKFIGEKKPIGLDLGAGSGRHLRIMREHFDRVLAVDFTRNSLVLCRPLTPDLVQGALPNLPFASEVFDFILCWGVLHYLKRDQLSIALRQIHAILKPGGSIFLTLRSDVDTHLRAQLARGDLKDGHAELFTKDEAIAMFRDFSGLRYGFISRQPLGEEHLVAHHMILATR